MLHQSALRYRGGEAEEGGVGSAAWRCRCLGAVLAVVAVAVLAVPVAVLAVLAVLAGAPPPRRGAHLCPRAPRPARLVLFHSAAGGGRGAT